MDNEAVRRNRRIAEDPLDTVGRLLADQVSAQQDEQVWDSYAQIDEERDVSRAAVVFDDQLCALVGQQLTIRIHHEGGTELVGTLQSVGDGWLRLCEPGADYIVATTSVVAVTGRDDLPRAAGSSGSSALGRASWASLLRELRGSSTRRPVSILTIEGALRSGRITSVGADFFTLERRSGIDGCYEGLTELIPTRAVILITSNF